MRHQLEGATGNRGNERLWVAKINEMLMAKQTFGEIMRWSVHDVVKFVKEFLGVEEYCRAVRAHHITGAILLYMPLNGWHDVGISVSSHRHALNGWIQEKLQHKKPETNFRKSLSFDDGKRHSAMPEAVASKDSFQESSHGDPEIIVKAKVDIEDDYRKLFRNVKEEDEKRKRGRAYLKDVSSAQKDAYNRNLKRIRQWLDDGVAGLTKEEFALVDLTTNAFVKNEVFKLIRERKVELEPFYMHKQAREWDDADIYEKLKLFRHYINTKASINNAISCQKKSSSSISMVQKHAPCSSDMEDTILKQAIQEHVIFVRVIGSFYYIPEEVIIFRSTIQKKTGRAEFSFINGMDEGTATIEVGIFRGSASIHPYETWHVEILEVVQGLAMSDLFIPGSQRKANTLVKGEVICVPTVFSCKTEFIEDSSPLNGGRSKVFQVTSTLT
ncbi:hypothetical protein L7F22_066983 [Adiantum nelumboides]|nr:hypothetical protein [Adiantum nelumboides]